MRTVLTIKGGVGLEMAEIIELSIIPHQWSPPPPPEQELEMKGRGGKWSPADAKPCFTSTPPSFRCSRCGGLANPAFSWSDESSLRSLSSTSFEV